MPKTAGRTILLAACLLLPYAGLLLPGLYNRPVPALLGFPFFYWYQLAWVIVTSILLLVAHRELKRR